MASKKSPFDQAVQQFNAKNYKKAAAEFEKIIGAKDADETKKAIAKKYLAICERQMAEPKKENSEPSLAQVSYLMNIGEFDQAKDILAKIETTPGTQDFLLAEMAIEEENEEVACEHLTKAIEANSDFRGYALNSIVFSPHLSNEAFSFLQTKKED